MAWQTLQFIIGMLPYPVGVYGGGISSTVMLWITMSSCLDTAALIQIYKMSVSCIEQITKFYSRSSIIELNSIPVLLYLIVMEDSNSILNKPYYSCLNFQTFH